MRLLVVTPLAVVVDAEGVRHVRAEDATGSFGVLPGHADLLTALTVSVLVYRDAASAERFVAVRGGVLTVSGPRPTLVQVFTREAVTGDDLGQLERQVLARFPVRLVVLRKRALVSKVLAIFQRVVFGPLRKAAGIPDGQGAAVHIEPRFGDGGRGHWHVHGLVADGVFHRPDGAGPPVFVHTPPPGRDELAQMVLRIRARVLRLLRRGGLLPLPAVQLHRPQRGLLHRPAQEECGPPDRGDQPALATVLRS